MRVKRFLLASLAASLPWFDSIAHAALRISDGTTQNVSCTSGICIATAKKAVLNVSDLAGMLAAGDVTVKSKATAQDILIEAHISWTSSHRLTLDSYRSIRFDKPVSVAGSPSALTITTNDGGTSGDFRFQGDAHVRIWDGNSSLIINGTPYELEHTLKGVMRSASRNSTGHLALARSIDVAENVFTAAPIASFGGTFEGLGNAISNLQVHVPPGKDVGLIGDFSGGVVRDLRLVSVNISGEGYAGAVAGETLGSIVNCSVSGSVTGAIVGGIVGKTNGGVVLNSKSSAAVSGGDGSVVGGVIGEDVSFNNHPQNYSTGPVTGGKRATVGGLAGSLRDGAPDSYATGSVTGGDLAHVGGLMGENAGAGPHHVYSTGAVSGPVAKSGGLIGKDMQNSGISDAYWDLDTSGIGDPSKGAGNIANDPGITGLSDAQLKSALPAGFDPTIWGQKPKINNGYPYLLSNPPH